jgi:hypothetical protein
MEPLIKASDRALDIQTIKTSRPFIPCKILSTPAVDHEKRKLMTWISEKLCIEIAVEITL